MIPILDEIRDLERRLRDAMRASALNELDALLADELVFTDHLGGLWGQQEDLAAHRSGAIHIDSLSASHEQILTLDGVGVVNVLLDIAGIFAGRAVGSVSRGCGRRRGPGSGR